MKEDAERGIKVSKVFDKVFKSENFTASDVRELAELTGQDPDELVNTFTAELKKAGDDDKGKKAPSAGAKVRMEDLPDSVQKLLKDAEEILPAAKESQVAEAEEKIKNMVAEEVAKDDFLGKIIVEAPEELQAGIKDVVTSMVQRDVRTKILASPYTKEKFGTEMIRNSIQTARADVKKLGIPSKSSKQADRISFLAALGPTGTDLPAEVYSDDTVERVPSNDPSYHDNAVARLGQKMRMAAAKSKAG
jgi:hypothetical protein